MPFVLKFHHESLKGMTFENDNHNIIISLKILTKTPWYQYTVYAYILPSLKKLFFIYFLFESQSKYITYNWWICLLKSVGFIFMSHPSSLLYIFNEETGSFISWFPQGGFCPLLSYSTTSVLVFPVNCCLDLGFSDLDFLGCLQTPSEAVAGACHQRLISFACLLLCPVASFEEDRCPAPLFTSCPSFRLLIWPASRKRHFFYSC